MQTVLHRDVSPGFVLPSVSLALFDLDDTLTDRDTDGLWAAWRARHSLHGLVEILRLVGIMRAYRQGRLSGERYMAYHRRRIESVGAGRMAAAAERFYRECGKAHVRPDIAAIARAHADAGARLVMVTAQNEFIAAPFARDLAMDLVANRFDIEGDRVGEARAPLSLKEGKIERVGEYCRLHGFSLADAAFYSDSRNDLPLLSAVGHPVAVAPDSSLRAAALAARWPIIDPAPVKKY